MAAYYNEIDPYAAEWLRNLIMLGHIADGIVDTRSISEVQPDELREFTQCHFFAGIGVWSHALRLAGWPDDRPVWTGSCPCQPFSSAGRSGGFADERHLWPHWQHLIRECKPGVVFGEQVASKDGLAWLDLVHDDMEGEGYAFTAVDLCAAGVGAPHIRQRLFFVADAASDRRRWKGSTAEVQAGRGQGSTERGELQGGPQGCGVVTVQRATLQGTGGMADAELYKQRQRGRSTSEGAEGYESGIESGGCGQVSGVADADDAGLQGGERRGATGTQGSPDGHVAERCGAGGMDHTHDKGLEGLRLGHQAEGGRIGAVRPVTEAGEPCRMADAFSEQHDGSGVVGTGRGSEHTNVGAACRSYPTNGHWRLADWLYCRDGKWRPVEPDTFPLAHGAPSRVGRLRAYGNAIVPQVAAEVIRTYIETR